MSRDDKFTDEERVLISMAYLVCIGMVAKLPYVENLGRFGVLADSMGEEKLTELNTKLENWQLEALQERS